MEIVVTLSSVVKPARQTPQHELWVSSLDLLTKRHSVFAYLYAPFPNFDSHSDVCILQKLREAFSEALVQFYPLAGRLIYDANGRIAVNCNGEGAVFVEAITHSEIADLGNFERPSDLRPLVPFVDYVDGITPLPLVVQVTKFSCGGMGIGVSISHILADGISFLHFVNTWCDIARGLGVQLPPAIDRSVLGARDPPTPSFSHTEYEPYPALINQEEIKTVDVSYKRFTVSKEQVTALKEKAAKNPTKRSFSTFVILAAHVWKCCSTARNLVENQKTKVKIAVDGRNRLQPPLPSGYFGNARFVATPIAVSGDLVSKPIWYTACKIQEEIGRMDDEYMRSQLDYLETKQDVSLPGRMFRCPNMILTSWRLPIYDADFGLGKPVFMGPVREPEEGHCYIMPSPKDDGSVNVCLALYASHMDRFQKLFYEI